MEKRLIYKERQKYNKCLTVACFCLFSLLFIGCRKSDNSQIPCISGTQQIENQLDSLFSALFPDSLPGAAVLVTYNDSVIYGKGFGLATLNPKSKINLNTLFNICSVSKQFSAVALLKLEEQGKLSLDDPILKYFPEWPHETFKDVRLYHLLNHTSGIPDSRPRNDREWQEYIKTHKTKFKNVNDFKLFCEEDESLRYLETLDSLSFKPGSEYEYINPTFQMVLGIVEKVTGQDFDGWMKENIFLPAQMDNTFYYEEGISKNNMAHGYEKDSVTGQWKECDYGEASFFGTKADGGLYTSPLQFVKWDNAIFHDLILSENSRNKAHTGYIQTDIPYTSYGYGWFIEEKPGRPCKIYHTGDNGGFLIFEGRFPKKNLFYLIFATHPHWNREETAEKFDKLLLSASLER